MSDFTELPAVGSAASSGIYLTVTSVLGSCDCSVVWSGEGLRKGSHLSVLTVGPRSTSLGRVEVCVVLDASRAVLGRMCYSVVISPSLAPLSSSVIHSFGWTLWVVWYLSSSVMTSRVVVYSAIMSHIVKSSSPGVPSARVAVNRVL